MISPQLLSGAGSANPTQDAFEAKTQQLTQQREKQNAAMQAEQDRKNNVFKQALSYAGDGYFNEAKYFAQQNGIEVPDEMLQNSAFSKGMSNAMELYDDDPEAAMRYAQGFSNAQGDLMARHTAGFAAGGKPRSKADRELALYERKLQIESKYRPSGGGGGFSLSAGQTRYDNAGNIIASAPAAGGDMQKLWLNTYNEAIAAMRTPEQAKEIADTAISASGRYGASSAQTALMGSGSQVAQPSSRRDQEIQSFIQQAKGMGAKPQDIKAVLLKRGVSPEIADQVIGTESTTLNQSVNVPSSPATIEQNRLDLRPVAASFDPNQTTRAGYYPLSGTVSPLENLTRVGANLTNIPGHMQTVSSGLVGAANLIDSSARGAGRAAYDAGSGVSNAVGEFMTNPSQVVVYDPQGAAYYLPRNQLQAALAQGYRTSNIAGPNVPTQ